MLNIILGGAKSGKTAHGLHLAEQAWHKNPNQNLIYIATAQIWDAEMAEKVRVHQAERTDQPWQTIEEPIAIPERLISADSQDIILLDSVGMWVSNILMSDKNNIAAEWDRLIDALQNCPARCFFIADEVGLGIVPATKLGRQFRDANGLVNQRLCASADYVDFVVAGLVQQIKSL